MLLSLGQTLNNTSHTTSVRLLAKLKISKTRCRLIITEFLGNDAVAAAATWMRTWHQHGIESCTLRHTLLPCLFLSGILREIEWERILHFFSYFPFFPDLRFFAIFPFLKWLFRFKKRQNRQKSEFQSIINVIKDQIRLNLSNFLKCLSTQQRLWL